MITFTMDGYRDLDAVAEELWSQGIEMGAKTKDQLRCHIAFTLRTIMEGLDIHKHTSDKATELYDVCAGIVFCAEDDELI